MKTSEGENPIPCANPLAEALLDDVRGLQDSDLAKQLAEHVAACPSCRDRRETLVWIEEMTQRWGTGIFEPHVRAAELVTYVERVHELDAGRLERIEKHLRLCGLCSIDLRMVRESGEATREHRTAPVAPRRRPARPSIPAWAYAALFAVLLPTAAGVGYWMRGPDSFVHSVPPAQSLMLQEERGAGDRSEVTLPGEGLLSLEFHLPILGDGSVRYDARLFNAAERELWSEEDLESLDDFGSFLLLLEPSRLEEGSHLLRVTETHRLTGEATQVFEFDFLLRR